METPQSISLVRERAEHKSNVVDAVRPTSVQPADTETFSGLVRVLRRRRMTVTAVAATIFALGIGLCCLLTPRFSATTTIEINKDYQSDNTAAVDSGTSATPDELKSEIQTDVQILKSDDLALGVINDLGLSDKKPFSSGIYSIEKGLPLDRAPRTRERILKLFSGSLAVASPQDTKLIQITFQSPDATLAAAVSEALANRFIDGTLERRHQSATQTSYWLQKELRDLKTEVEQSEQKLADYQRETGLAGVEVIGTSNGNGAATASTSPHNTVTDRLYTLNQELTSAEASRIAAQTIYDLVRSHDPEVVLGLGSMSIASGSGGGSVGALVLDGGIQLIRSLRAQLADLAREYSAESVKYGVNNPRLIHLQQQMSQIKQQLQDELDRITLRAANSYRYAKNTEDSIRNQFVGQQGAANIMADKTVHLQVLAQEAYSNRALYESLFSKLQTASLSSGVRATRIDIVDRARPAGTPSSPQYSKYLAIIFGLGAFLGITAAFLQESFDDTVRTGRDLDDIPQLPTLGYLPRLEPNRSAEDQLRQSNLIVSPASPFSEAFRSLRTSVLHSLPRNEPRTLLITSATGGDGKTTVAYNLAIAFAQQGARVLLIDADVRNPDLHRLFGTQLSPGLGDVHSWDDTSQLPRMVEHKTLSSLFLLPAGTQPDLPSEFLSSPVFDSLLQSCVKCFDFVLIDSPPILAVTDASILATKVTAAIAVLRSQRTTRPMAAALVKTLERTQAATIGLVLNDVRQPALNGFYSYKYSREKGYQLNAG